jgi:hypothetical protein
MFAVIILYRVVLHCITLYHVVTKMRTFFNQSRGCRSGTATALALHGTSRILAYLTYCFNYVCTAESTVPAHEVIMLDDG